MVHRHHFQLDNSHICTCNNNFNISHMLVKCTRNSSKIREIVRNNNIIEPNSDKNPSIKESTLKCRNISFNIQPKFKKGISN